jgi:hypothetical protein
MIITVVCSNCREQTTVKVLEVTEETLTISIRHLPIYKDSLFCCKICLAEFKKYYNIKD